MEFIPLEDVFKTESIIRYVLIIQYTVYFPMFQGILTAFPA